MSAKQITYQHEARDAIRDGVRKLARAVKVTLGPRGRNVIIQKSYGTPTVTKDGVTVANEIELEDSYENMGAQMVKEVASKTNAVAGDGTTSATVLAEAIFDEGLKNVTAGANPMDLKRGIDTCVEAIVDQLHKMAIKVKGSTEIAQVGAIAANNEMKIGEMIAEAMEKVGKDGVITVEEGKSLDTEVEWVEGMQFDKGYQSPHFVTNTDDMECVLEDPYILVHEKKIGSIKDLLPVLEAVAKANAPLLIVSEEVEGEALATLVVNKLRGIFSCCAVKASGFGDRRKAMLEDIAILTGGQAVFEDLGIRLDGVELKHLGRAKKVIISKDATTIIEGAGKKKDIQARIGAIRGEIDNTSSDYDREKLQERLAKLSGGVAQINVGAATEVEMKEKKARVEDALHATRAAVEEGILPGGGTALLRAIDAVWSKLDLQGDQKIGADIVRRAVEAPLRQIATNAGHEGALVVQQVRAEKSKTYGFNAATGEYTDLVADGVIDPTKVVRSSLEHAASVSGLLLTTEAVISEIKDDKAGGGMPDMDY